jgi:hypothetical protein
MRRKESETEISRIAWADEMTKEEMNSFVEKEKERLAKLSEISIALTTYNDIFSSFDPRPYAQKALSDDFLEETKRASSVKNSEDIELKLLMPASRRNLSEETIIKKRLKDYFKKHESLARNEVNSTIKKGALFISFGIIFMVIATFFLYTWENPGFMVKFLLILFEPGGWFFFWEGLNLIVFEAKAKTPESDFMKRLASCKINFYSY